MAEHRERVDLRMMREINRRVMTPLLIDLGARYLVRPYMGKYDDEEKSCRWGFGHKKHGDKRHRTTVTYQGINYVDGEMKDGKTYSRVEDRYSAWSVQHDNRLVQNDETITKKVVSYEETYNQIETFSSLDLMQRFSATAQGEIAGIGGSVTTTTEAKAHTEVSTEKYDRKRREVVLDTSARIFYPGPVYRDDYDANGQFPAGRWCRRAKYGWWIGPLRLCTRSRPLSRKARGMRALSLTLKTGPATMARCRTGSIGTCWNSATCRNLCTLWIVT